DSFACRIGGINHAKKATALRTARNRLIVYPEPVIVVAVPVQIGSGRERVSARRSQLDDRRKLQAPPQIENSREDETVTFILRRGAKFARSENIVLIFRRAAERRRVAAIGQPAREHIGGLERETVRKPFLQLDVQAIIARAPDGILHNDVGQTIGVQTGSDKIGGHYA